MFSELPDNPPFLCACLRDPDSGFASRLMYGTTFGSASSMFRFEFYGLIMERYRQVELHPTYGETWMPVSSMTDEEKEKYNK